MNNKILLTIMLIVALLIAVYKWILSDDKENEETEQKVEETETATSEKENVKPEEKIEEIKEKGEDKVENHK